MIAEVILQKLCFTRLSLTIFFTDQRQHEQRRKVRLLQVRKLSKEAAEKVRTRVRTGQVREVQKVGQQELQKVFAVSHILSTIFLIFFKVKLDPWTFS